MSLILSVMVVMFCHSVMVVFEYPGFDRCRILIRGLTQTVTIVPLQESGDSLQIERNIIVLTVIFFLNISYSFLIK